MSLPLFLFLLVNIILVLNILEYNILHVSTTHQSHSSLHDRAMNETPSFYRFAFVFCEVQETCITRTNSFKHLFINHIYVEHLFMSKKEAVQMYLKILTTDFIGHVRNG